MHVTISLQYLIQDFFLEWVIRASQRHAYSSENFLPTQTEWLGNYIAVALESLPVKAKSPSYSFPSCHFTRHLPSLRLPSTILEKHTIAVPSSTKSRRACEAVGFSPEKNEYSINCCTELD